MRTLIIPNRHPCVVMTRFSHFQQNKRKNKKRQSKKISTALTKTSTAHVKGGRMLVKEKETMETQLKLFGLQGTRHWPAKDMDNGRQLTPTSG